MKTPPQAYNWPFNTRVIASIASKFGLSFEEHSDGEGYLFSLTSASGELFLGTGPIDSYPINPSTSSTIARDKFFSYRVAKHLGIATIETELFFLSDRFSAARIPGRELQDLFETVEDRPYPIFAKPNKGSRGDFAEAIGSADELKSYIRRVSAHYDQVVIQPYILGSEIRLFLIDETCFFQYQKKPLRLYGNDKDTWDSLIDSHNSWLISVGLSEIPKKAIIAHAHKQEISFHAVSESEQYLTLPGRRNISAQSAPDKFTTDADPALKTRASRIMEAIGLRVAAVDFILPDPQGNRIQPDPIFLEINGNPSIDSLEAAGRIGLAKDIWSLVLTKWKEARSHENLYS